MIFLIRSSTLYRELIPEYDECDATCDEPSADINSSYVSYTPVNDEKFLTYLPHSQFHNQFIELKNAFALAYLTNRTLIIPPILRFNQSKLPLPHSTFYSLYDRLDIITNIKKDRLSCNLNQEVHPKHCSPKYSKYDSFIMINWEEIFDFSWIKNQIKIIKRKDFSIENLYKICNIQIKETRSNSFRDLLEYNENVYVIKNQDKNLYSYKFFDTNSSDNIYSLGKYDSPYLISDLQKREEKLIHIDTLFGSARINYRNENVIKWTIDMNKSLRIHHPILLKVANDIINKLGGFESYFGAHVRIGDGKFRKNFRNTIDDIVENLKNVTQANSVITSNPVNSGYHFLNYCKSQKKQIIFIATDSSDPRTELLSIFLEFPCTFTLEDFKRLVDPLRNITYTFDKNVKMLDFFYPLLDLLIIANGKDVVGTHNSTFSKFAKFYNQILK